MPQLTVDWYGAKFPDQKKPKNKQTETEKTQGLDAFCGAKKVRRVFSKSSSRVAIGLGLKATHFTTYLQMSA